MGSGQARGLFCKFSFEFGGKAHYDVHSVCKLQAEGQSLMRAAMTQLNLLARAYHRILKLARTIADLAEALHYGEWDMNYCVRAV